MNKQMVQLLKNQAEMLAAMVDETKAASSSGNAPSIFGDGGMLSKPGLEREVINAYIAPSGIEEYIPALPSTNEHPMFTLLTGVEGDGASPATNVCDDNPSGYITSATLTAQFGRTAFDTNTIDSTKISRKAQKGITTDLQLYGNMLNRKVPNPSTMSDDAVIDLITESEMLKVGALFQSGVTNQMGLSRQFWQGNPAVVTSGKGYQQFAGLSRQVATGQLDAFSGATVAGIDSLIFDMDYGDLEATDLKIVDYLAELEFHLYTKAQKTGLLPVKWALVMRPEQWHVLTSVYPIAYNTNKGASLLSGNTRMVVDGGDMIAERDRMRREMTIDINGRTYPVITDYGIAELTSTDNASIAAGEFAATVYFMPLTITGGFPVLYQEYVDYRAGKSELSVLGTPPPFWTDKGMFSWAFDGSKWCFKLSAVTERRIVLRTPQLAGRIDNVKYSPLRHLASPFEDSVYNEDGGVSTQSVVSTSHVW